MAHASGSRCKNTSPRRPPTAKLKSNFSLFAAAEIEQNVSKSEQLTISKTYNPFIPAFEQLCYNKLTSTKNMPLFLLLFPITVLYVHVPVYRFNKVYHDLDLNS